MYFTFTAWQGAQKITAICSKILILIMMIAHDLTQINTTMTRPCTLQYATGIGIVEYKLHWLLMKWQVGSISYKEYVEINLN